MKSVSIPIEIRTVLDDYRGSKPITKAVKELSNEFDEIGDLGESQGSININVDDETFERLSRQKLYPTESVGSVIFRMIRMKKMRDRFTYNTSTINYTYRDNE